MKKFLLFSILACFGLIASAQKVYFLYLQTEDFSPFYVRMSDKIYSSASSGYLIIPNLVDTTYYLSVGFAKSTEPETKFSVAVNQGDKGFLIKKFDDGLALFDFEQLSVVKSATTDKDNTVYETKSDNFSNVLSKAAGDPSIVRVPVKKVDEQSKVEKKEEAVAKTEESKPAENPPVQTGNANETETTKEPTITSDAGNSSNSNAVDSMALQQPAKDTTATVQQPSINPVEATQGVAFKPSIVSRHSESSTTEGFGIVYFDQSETETDTVRILIPSSKVKPEPETETAPVAEVQTKESKVDSLNEVKSAVVDNKADETKPSADTEKKSLCKNTATDKDFLKLRKKMASGNTDEEMVEEAKKDFRSKCYSVEQLKYLSTLFLTSAAKYQFFDAAYEHVSDRNNFASLGAEIKDEYYAKRFKALIGE